MPPAPQTRPPAGAPAIEAPGFLTGPARRSWELLGRPYDRPAGRTPTTFDPGSLAGLPEPAARWLRHVLEPGTPLTRGVRLTMHGEIRVGRWLPFRARQVLAPDGFVWAAAAGRFPLLIRGFDRLTAGEGEMRWRLWGLLPVMTASGRDTSRSAAGRHAGEALVLAPGTALAPDVTWSPRGENRAVARFTSGAGAHDVTVEVGAEGRLVSVELSRWGNPDRGDFAEHPFGVVFEGESVHGGHVLPSRLRAGWWFGTERFAEGEFFRAEIDAAEHF